MSEPLPEDMICPLYKMALLMRHGGHSLPNNSDELIKCDGEQCALWSHKSGMKRCGMRNI